MGAELAATTSALRCVTRKPDWTAERAGRTARRVRTQVGQASTSAAVSRAHASRRCSQLPNTSNMLRLPIQPTSICECASLGCSRTPWAETTVRCISWAASTGARPTCHTPSGTNRSGSLRPRAQAESCGNHHCRSVLPVVRRVRSSTTALSPARRTVGYAVRASCGAGRAPRGRHSEVVG